MNQEILPAIFINFPIALNGLFVTYFFCRMFEIINYGNIWNNTDTKINLYHPNMVELTITIYVLTTISIQICKWNCKYASRLLMIFTLLQCLFDALFALKCNHINILLCINDALQQMIELGSVCSMFIHNCCKAFTLQSGSV